MQVQLVYECTLECSFLFSSGGAGTVGCRGTHWRGALNGLHIVTRDLPMLWPSWQLPCSREHKAETLALLQAKYPVQPNKAASRAPEACLMSVTGSMQAQLQRSADRSTLPTCRDPDACTLSRPGRVCSCASSARWRQGSTSRRCPSRVCTQSTREKLARLTPFSTCKH